MSFFPFFRLALLTSERHLPNLGPNLGPSLMTSLKCRYGTAFCRFQAPRFAVGRAPDLSEKGVLDSTKLSLQAAKLPSNTGEDGGSSKVRLDLAWRLS